MLEGHIVPHNFFQLLDLLPLRIRHQVFPPFFRANPSQRPVGGRLVKQRLIEHPIPVGLVALTEDERPDQLGVFGEEGSTGVSRVGSLPQGLNFGLQAHDLLFEGVDQRIDAEQQSVLGDILAVDGLVTVGAVHGLAVFDEFRHAGRTTTVLVGTHHHGRVLPIIELPHTHEALPLQFVLHDGLRLLIHPLQVSQLHKTMINVINV